jgi:hypothetical protein
MAVVLLSAIYDFFCRDSRERLLSAKKNGQKKAQRKKLRGHLFLLYAKNS